MNTPPTQKVYRYTDTKIRCNKGLARLRFLKKVNKTDTCWLWIGDTNKKGYGLFYFNGRMTHAHHFLLDAKPDWDKKEMACHKCNEPSCVNPAHIYIGTHQTNMEDLKANNRKSYATH